jgi:hypothetical protein
VLNQSQIHNQRKLPTHHNFLTHLRTIAIGPAYEQHTENTSAQMPSKKVRARERKAAVAGAPMQTDESMISTIRDKWHEQTKATGGYFLRFLDGDTGNCRLDNLDYCHPHDAFTNADWVVDWDMELTMAESAFVRANLDTFATIYEAQAGKPRPKKNKD